ncbi:MULTISPECIES: hemerythrin family protein [unclassified Pseudodesulfovibrio]|uniref:bacteriohemerythrin n=1 Tax=unclassified Pseudodesulfovibrio TaxID=2661612 RepID=UPI0013E38112|nr:MULTISPECIES: hemerythrin family protein [unclassified Pseudodesulfovibrio]MCJ2164864.1 hemerythrin family protein [Pseudodesulfovibrio sp. S3-i]
MWKTEYLLQLDEIDDQHKHFFALCGEVAQLAETATRKKESIVSTIKALGMLRAYAFLHFRTEEEIMLRHGFPKYLKHTGCHNNYLEKMIVYEKGFKALLENLDQNAEGGKLLKTFLKEVSEFVVEWWSTHIQEQDALYAVHIKEKKPQDLIPR